MKALILSLLLIPSITFAQRHHATPTPTPNPPEGPGPSRQELFQTVDHIVRLSQDLQKNLELEKAAHHVTDMDLANAKTENASLQKRIDKETDTCNETADKYAAAMKKVWWYRIHFFLGWVLFITGILAGVGIWVLKITGKLGVMAAKL